MCDHITCFSTQSLSKAFHALIKSNFCKVLGSLDTTVPMFPYLQPIQTAPQLPQLFSGSCASIPVSQSIFLGCTFCMDCPDITTWYTFYTFGFFSCISFYIKPILIYLTTPSPNSLTLL